MDRHRWHHRTALFGTITLLATMLYSTPAGASDGDWVSHDLGDFYPNMGDSVTTGDTTLVAADVAHPGCGDCGDIDFGAWLRFRYAEPSVDRRTDERPGFATTGSGEVVGVHAASDEEPGTARLLASSETGGGWSEDEVVRDGMDALYLLGTGTDAEGHVYAWWSETTGTMEQARLSRRIGASWGPALAFPASWVDHVVPGPEGLHAFWRADDGVAQAVLTGAGWSDPEIVAPSDGGELAFHAAAGIGGRPAVIASVSSPRHALLVSQRTADQNWNTSRVATGARVAGFELVTGPAGRQDAYWSETDGADSWRFRAARRTAIGDWSRTRIASVGSPFRWTVVTGSAGHDVFWFEPLSDDASILSAARRTPEGWRTTILAPGRDDYLLAASDSRGNVSVFWPAKEYQGVEIAQRPVGSRAWRGRRLRTASADGGLVALAGDRLAILDSEIDGQPWMSRISVFTPAVAETRVHGVRARLPSTRLSAAWRTTWTTAESHDIRMRRARADGPFGDWSRLRTRSKSNHLSRAGRPGRTYCFQARAHDGSGRIGPWSKEQCSTTAVDDRALRRADGRWRRTNPGRAYRNTLSVAKQHGSGLVLEGGRARAVALYTGPNSRGKVRVRFAGRDLGTVSLARADRIVEVAAFDRLRRGRLVITVVSRGKPVRIDGVFLARR